MASIGSVSDRRKIVRSQLSDRPPFCGVLTEDVGQVVYPEWFKQLPDIQSRNAFRDRVLVDYTEFRPNEPGQAEMFHVSVRMVFDTMSQTSVKPDSVFNRTGECLMCQYIILASFFPELLASNIVEFAPLMNMGRDIVMNDGYLDARLIRSACYQCQLCQKYLPGRYPAKYHPLIVSLAEGGEKFPEESDDMSCYSDIARAYEKIILMDGISRKTVILANSVVRSILANSISARAQNVWSDDPDLDLPLDEYSYRLVVFDETVINDFNVHTLPRLVVPGKSRMNDMNVRAKLWSDETAKNYWSPTGSMSMFFSYIGWYTTDPRVIFDDENTHRLRYALASIANLRE